MSEAAEISVEEEPGREFMSAVKRRRMQDRKEWEAYWAIRDKETEVQLLTKIGLTNILGSKILRLKYYNENVINFLGWKKLDKYGRILWKNFFNHWDY